MTERPPGPLRIALVQATSRGGVGRHVRRLAMDLAAGGDRVLVVGPPSGGAERVPDSAAAAAAAPDVAELPVGDRPRAADLATIARLRRLTRGADVVHAHGARAGALAVLAHRGLASRRRGSTGTASREAGPAIVVTLHNAAPVATGWVRGLHALLERLVARGADLVLGVSADLEARMRELGAADVGHAVVPAPPAPPPTRTARQVRTALGLGDGQALLVTAARLAPQKGLDLLLDAVALLAPRPVQAVVVGEGPLRAALQARVDAERLPVALVGNRDDVPDLFAAADVAVVSSVWEGQPLAVQEALRAGAPLVATDVGGTAQVAGTAAVLVPYGHPRALAEAIARLLDEPQERTRRKAQSLARAAQLPTDRDAAQAARDAYARALGRRTARP